MSLKVAYEAPPAPAPRLLVPRDKLIDLQSVCTLCGIKKSTVYAWLKDPASDFPRPVRLSSRMVRWGESAVLSWVQSRINQATQVQQ